MRYKHKNVIAPFTGGFLSGIFVCMERINDLLARIRNRLDELGVDQKALASFLGLTQGNISRRLSGQTAFRPVELAKLERLLGISLLANTELTQIEDPGMSLVLESLSILSARDRKELYFVIALILESKLAGSQRGYICDSLRTLAGLKTMETGQTVGVNS